MNKNFNLLQKPKTKVFFVKPDQSMLQMKTPKKKFLFFHKIHANEVIIVLWMTKW